MAKFLLLPCKFSDADENDEMLQDMGVAVRPSLITDYLCLNLDDVSCFNPSGDGEISVTLKNGERFLVLISFSDFCGVIHEHIGEILEMVKR